MRLILCVLAAFFFSLVFSKATPELRLENVIAIEGTDAFLTLRLNEPADSLVTLDFVTVPLSAEGGSDFEPLSGTVSIPVGETTATIDLSILADDEPETPETFSVRLTQVTGASVRPNPTHYLFHPASGRTAMGDGILFVGDGDRVAKFERSDDVAGGWALTQTLTRPPQTPSGFGSQLYLRGNQLLVRGANHLGKQFPNRRRKP